MNVTPRWVLCALLLGTAPSALAQDEIILGDPILAAPGEVARVPIFIRDVAGTPLGTGGLAPIQWIDFSVTHSHPHLIVGCLGTTYPNCDLQFEAAGIMASSPPETSGTLINIASLYVRRIFAGPLPFTGGRDLIGFITFRLDPKAPIGTIIRLQFDPTKTFFADHGGTIVDRNLKPTSTTVDVESCLDPPATPSFDFFGPVSKCTSTSRSCHAGEDVEFTTIVNPINPCDTLTWSFGDGTTATNVSTVRHRFTLPTGGFSPSSSPTLATYTVSATLTRAGGSAVTSHRVSIQPGCTATVPETAVAGSPVRFTADTIPPGLFSRVEWKFGDGTTGLGTPVDHTYPFGFTYLWEAALTIPGIELPCVVRRPIEVSGPIPRRRLGR